MQTSPLESKKLSDIKNCLRDHHNYEYNQKASIPINFLGLALTSITHKIIKLCNAILFDNKSFCDKNSLQSLYETANGRGKVK